MVLGTLAVHDDPPRYAAFCWTSILAIAVLAEVASARPSDEPIRLAWDEGDVAGMTTLYDPDGRKPIGTVDYRQTRKGNRLTTRRVSRFRDGSSDEDTAVARVDGVLEALSGRSIIRDEHGSVVVDLSIDVVGRRLTAVWRDDDGERHTMDEEMDLPKATYWGPLIHIVLKNFGTNEEDGRVVFHTVAVTPKPRAIDMEFRRRGRETIERPGMSIETERFALSPTVHWLIDPLIRRFAPNVAFWMTRTKPPGMARFLGPRNYARQRVLIE